MQFRCWQPVLASVRHALLAAWRLVLSNSLLRELEQLEEAGGCGGGPQGIEGPGAAGAAARLAGAEPGSAGDGGGAPHPDAPHIPEQQQQQQQADGSSFQEWLRSQQAEAGFAPIASGRGHGSGRQNIAAAASGGMAAKNNNDLPEDAPAAGSGGRHRGSGRGRQLSGAKHTLASRLVRYNAATAQPAIGAAAAAPPEQSGLEPAAAAVVACLSGAGREEAEPSKQSFSDRRHVPMQEASHCGQLGQQQLSCAQHANASGTCRVLASLLPQQERRQQQLWGGEEDEQQQQPPWQWCREEEVAEQWRPRRRRQRHESWHMAHQAEEWQPASDSPARQAQQPPAVLFSLAAAARGQQQGTCQMPAAAAAQHQPLGSGEQVLGFTNINTLPSHHQQKRVRWQEDEEEHKERWKMAEWLEADVGGSGSPSLHAGEDSLQRVQPRRRLDLEAGQPHRQQLGVNGGWALGSFQGEVCEPQQGQAVRGRRHYEARGRLTEEEQALLQGVATAMPMQPRQHRRVQSAPPHARRIRRAVHAKPAALAAGGRMASTASNPAGPARPFAPEGTFTQPVAAIGLLPSPNEQKPTGQAQESKPASNAGRRAGQAEQHSTQLHANPSAPMREAISTSPACLPAQGAQPSANPAQEQAQDGQPSVPTGRAPVPDFLQPDAGLAALMPTWRQAAHRPAALARKARGGASMAARQPSDEFAAAAGPAGNSAHGAILSLEALAAAAFVQLVPSSLSREQLVTARVLRQVDRKFVPLVCSSSSSSSCANDRGRGGGGEGSGRGGEETLLALVDQHAAGACRI